jgi:hypothetical protein
MIDIDWSDDDVAKFIAEQINYYGFEVSPEQSKQGMSPWKRWLWLEKHGFDFAYVSLEQEIAQFRINLDRSVVSLESERRLLLAIRGVMREILSLPPLDAEAQARLLSTVPISNRTHWASVRRPYGADRADKEADYSDVIAYIWRFMEHDKPNYLRILGLIKNYDDNNLEEFTDHYTINGTYVFMSGPPAQVMQGMVTQYHRKRTYDAFFAPGSLLMHDFITETFMKSIETKLS